MSEDDARRRRTPTLSDAPLLALKYSPRAGYGVFAAQDIPAATPLLSASAPAVCVVYRAFRKEVCAWCFTYESGRTWKVRLDVTGVLVFCCEACREGWAEEYGSDGMEAYVAVEAFVQRQARRQGWQCDEETGEGIARMSSEQELDEAWNVVEMQAELIRAFRLRSTNSQSLSLAAPLVSPAAAANLSSEADHKSTFKAQRQALADAMCRPVHDTDLLFFLLSGVLCRASPRWPALLALNPSPAYASLSALARTTTAYLHLLAVLPRALLPDRTLLCRATLEAVLARDVGNSFGVWSTDAGAEGAEMLGYGTWPRASFFNHACAPSVARRRVGRAWVFEAACDVRAGTELCISYIRGEEDVLCVEERRRRLQVGWGFTCRCVKCTREEEKA